MAGDVGDLALLDTGGRGAGGASGPERVAGELGDLLGHVARRLTMCATDWSERRSPVKGVAAVHPTEHWPAVDPGGLEVGVERAVGLGSENVADGMEVWARTRTALRAPGRGCQFFRVS